MWLRYYVVKTIMILCQKRENINQSMWVEQFLDSFIRQEPSIEMLLVQTRPRDWKRFVSNPFNTLLWLNSFPSLQLNLSWISLDVPNWSFWGPCSVTWIWWNKNHYKKKKFHSIQKDWIQMRFYHQYQLHHCHKLLDWFHLLNHCLEIRPLGSI